VRLSTRSPLAVQTDATVSSGVAGAEGIVLGVELSRGDPDPSPLEIAVGDTGLQALTARSKAAPDSTNARPWAGRVGWCTGSPYRPGPPRSAFANVTRSSHQMSESQDPPLHDCSLHRAALMGRPDRSR
jgi:hypothetical protein